MAEKNPEASSEEATEVKEVAEIENPYSGMADSVIEKLVIESEKYYLEKVKPFYENQKHLISEIHRRKGLGFYFQDKESGAVLKTIQEDYKTISLFNLGIHRTRFSDDEAKQSLSNKEAESKGFKLKLGDRRKKK